MPRLSREQSREITRDKLRLSAIHEIATNGFVGASIDRICESAGFSRGAFYANFKSKEDLLLNIMRTHHDRETGSWIAMMKSDQPFSQMLPVLREKFADYIADQNRIMFMTEVQLYALRNQAFLSRYKEELLSVSFKAEDVLQAIFEKVGKRPHRPLSTLAIMMRALLAGLVLDVVNHGQHPAQSADQLIFFLEDLLNSGDDL